MTADQTQDDRLIVFFDIDNTLYSASSKISYAMGERIHAYFTGLGMPEDEASELHHKYYSQYGLALRGLTRHHNVADPEWLVDPLDFDAKCDGSLPLEEMIKPDPFLKQLFQDIDRSKVRVWALTNAYRTHAQRVLRILDLEDQVDGLIFCDYAQPNFSCKPEPEFYQQALKQARVTDTSRILFIDDNLGNVKAAQREGWGRCVHFCEAGLLSVEGGQVRTIGDDTSSHYSKEQNVPQKVGEIAVVNDLQQLRSVWPDMFLQAPET